MKLIIYDFEVFPNDVLLGAIIVDGKKEEIFQSWDLDEIRELYHTHKNDTIFVGYNSEHYDRFIFEAIVNGNDPYKVSKSIIKNDERRGRCKLPMYSYDIMSSMSRSMVSLKLTEMMTGHNIDISEVDFDKPYLTQEERLKTESYNRSDLEQTRYLLKTSIDKFKLRLNIIKRFDLDLRENLTATGTQLAAHVLKAKNNPDLEYDRVEPVLWPNLRLKNERIKQFYLNKEYELGKKDVVNVAGANLTISSGGLHSGIKKYHCDKFIYCDVSGMYNLCMLNFDLLPRTMSQEGKELYEFMYHEQLKMKKTNPVMRVVYKTILLSVFGAMGNKYTDFYDPSKLFLVCLTGQLFVIDLLEKLDGLCEVIQTNTDGIMIRPYDWNDKDKIISICEEWEKRSGFVLKKEFKTNLWQRDVNCYIFQNEDGSVVVKGEAVKNYFNDEAVLANGTQFDAKEPPIIAKGIVQYLIYGKSPEETVEESKKSMISFQYPCKKGVYDKLILETNDFKTRETTVTDIPKISRCFASNDRNRISQVYKTKGESKTKIANLPSNVFVYNGDITNVDLSDRIDYSWYVKRIYERIDEFIPNQQMSLFD